MAGSQDVKVELPSPPRAADVKHESSGQLLAVKGEEEQMKQLHLAAEGATLENFREKAYNYTSLVGLGSTFRRRSLQLRQRLSLPSTCGQHIPEDMTWSTAVALHSSQRTTPSGSASRRPTFPLRQAAPQSHRPRDTPRSPCLTKSSHVDLSHKARVSTLCADSSLFWCLCSF